MALPPARLRGGAARLLMEDIMPRARQQDRLHGKSRPFHRRTELPYAASHRADRIVRAGQQQDWAAVPARKRALSAGAAHGAQQLQKQRR